MKRVRRLIAGMCAALACSIGLNLYLWSQLPSGGTVRSEERDGAETAEVEGEAKRSSDSSAGRVSLPVPCPESEADVAETSGASPQSGGFDEEQRDSVWASSQETAIDNRLRDMTLDATSVPIPVECRHSCCRISPPEDYDERHLVSDIQSAAGFDHWASGMSFHSEGIDLCFDRDGDTFRSTAPNRAVERRTVLLAASPALDKCALAADVAFDLGIAVGIDLHGAVSHVSREGELSGTDVATCAELAILQSAEFAEAPFASSLWFHLRIEPP